MLAVVLMAAALVPSHALVHPKTIRAGIKLDRVVLSVTYDASPGDEAVQLRRMFDRDADGALDAKEQAKLAELMERTALLWLEVRVGGEKRKLEKVEGSSHHLAEPASSSVSLGVTLLYEVRIDPPAPGAVVEVAIADRDRDASKHVPVTVDVGDGLVVALASQGELEPRSRQIQRVRLSQGAPLRLVLRRPGS